MLLYLKFTCCVIQVHVLYNTVVYIVINKNPSTFVKWYFVVFQHVSTIVATLNQTVHAVVKDTCAPGFRDCFQCTDII